MPIRTQGLSAGALCALAMLLAGGAVAETSPGVTADTIRFAQIAALEGQSGVIGAGIRTGLLAAFEEVNQRGGVHGRKLTLDSFDDGYEPLRASELAREVIAGDAHLALVGTVGTPTNTEIQPQATAAGWPLIGPASGASFLRDPALTNVVNVRASYATETEEWARYLVDELGLTRIAILHQDDSFGKSGLAGLTEALKARGLAPVAVATYRRNTTAVKAGLLTLRAANPQAIGVVAADKAYAEFVRTAHDIGFAPRFMNISFIGAKALIDAFEGEGAGAMVSQVVPLPSDPSMPIVADYQAAVRAIDPKATPDFATLEGYVTGRILIAGLDKAGPELTRASLSAALTGLGAFDVGGLRASLAPGDNQALEQIFITQVTAEGRYAAVGQ